MCGLGLGCPPGSRSPDVVCRCTYRSGIHQPVIVSYLLGGFSSIPLSKDYLNKPKSNTIVFILTSSLRRSATHSLVHHH
jgi:hypothetical protein